MKFSLYSLDRKIEESVDVSEVYYCGPKGESGVLTGHVSLISELDVGEVRIKREKTKKYSYYAISYGFINIDHDCIVICASTAESPIEIDLAQAVRIQKDAQQRLTGFFDDEFEFYKHESDLRLAVIRQQVAKRN